MINFNNIHVQEKYDIKNRKIEYVGSIKHDTKPIMVCERTHRSFNYPQQYHEYVRKELIRQMKQELYGDHVDMIAKLLKCVKLLQEDSNKTEHPRPSLERLIRDAQAVIDDVRQA